ncbi:HAMP domain-containing histidine kinase [Actinoplanes sp. LDG1-06]|uniref:histidine kinase n=1 Tax=Paractinoplanes ovalisporus TaxID=2810368 RepID=A0ABS2ACG9_9ACTN|nr:HAMP domain-containing sensor histidine kinase [Actinoplanes ovalisporus]MBM2616969.1 HAMP domain-containing histidine kinase [Actinoplanes ovalisporus]
MPDRPDYAALTRGQIAVLDRINAGEAGLPVLQQIVRLAQETLGGRGAGFAEYSADHGRIIAATGACTAATGRRVDRADTRLRDGRTLLIPLDSLNDEFAKQVEGGDVHRMLGARCEVGETIVGSLHVYFGDRDDEPGPEHHAVLELLAGYVGRLYAARDGLPVHSGEQARRQEKRDLWVAVTSHELRTPVTVIKGYADTLSNHWDTLGDVGRHEAVRIINTRAGELARLVDRLLSAASEDGDVGASPAGPFDLAEALRAAVEELPADLRRRIVLDNLPGELPKAYGERDSIATILTELATNAEKHSPPGSMVELCAAADEETLRFRLSDRGVGIRPEHVEQAFERYWQAEGGDRRHHPGAGLGLYLVRRLVERQHGWVSLRPREGGGTTAEVRLPRA